MYRLKNDRKREMSLGDTGTDIEVMYVDAYLECVCMYVCMFM